MDASAVAALRELLGREDVIEAVEECLNASLPRVHRMPRSAVRSAFAAVLELAEAPAADTGTAVLATEHTVSCLPEGHRERGLFEITVAYRSPGKWAVIRWQRCLGIDGEWDFESIPSEREDGWKATHRFDLDTALRLAREAAPKVTVNGFTVADALKMGADR